MKRPRMTAVARAQPLESIACGQAIVRLDPATMDDVEVVAGDVVTLRAPAGRAIVLGRVGLCDASLRDSAEARIDESLLDLLGVGAGDRVEISKTPDRDALTQVVLICDEQLDPATRELCAERARILQIPLVARQSLRIAGGGGMRAFTVHSVRPTKGGVIGPATIVEIRSAAEIASLRAVAQLATLGDELRRTLAERERACATLQRQVEALERQTEKAMATMDDLSLCLAEKSEQLTARERSYAERLREVQAQLAQRQGELASLVEEREASTPVDSSAMAGALQIWREKAAKLRTELRNLDASKNGEAGD